MHKIADIIDKVICGSVFDKLPEIPTGIVNCCVTSPPYWGLRDYGVEGQLGLEKPPEEYVAKMVAVFREVWRVLRDDGTLWLNMGDSYASSPTGSQGNYTGEKWGFGPNHKKKQADFQGTKGRNKIVSGLKPKDLCGIPWRVAFALQEDGWYLRQDVIEEVELYCPCGCGYILEERVWRYSQDQEIIWKKPNPMPESVRDRCTKAHEYIFLLTKKPKYYYDAEAIKKETDPANWRYGTGERKYESGGTGLQPRTGLQPTQRLLRNKRSVWTVPTKPYSEAHFATFPPDLILPCILAGCPQQVCKKCGEPRLRITETEQIKRRRKTPTTKPCDDRSPSANDVAGVESKTVGWTDCGCGAGFDGGIVIDIFMGSGTVGLVAYQNNRHYIGIELNSEYCKLGRIQAERDKYALFAEQE